MDIQAMHIVFLVFALVGGFCFIVSAVLSASFLAPAYWRFLLPFVLLAAAVGLGRPFFMLLHAGLLYFPILWLPAIAGAILGPTAIGVLRRDAQAAAASSVVD